MTKKSFSYTTSKSFEIFSSYNSTNAAANAFTFSLLVLLPQIIHQTKSVQQILSVMETKM